MHTEGTACINNVPHLVTLQVFSLVTISAGGIVMEDGNSNIKKIESEVSLSKTGRKISAYLTFNTLK